jgi:hypothetical protein
MARIQAQRRAPSLLRARRSGCSSVNVLTPFVGDANIETPEYKAFLVDVEPVEAPQV